MSRHWRTAWSIVRRSLLVLALAGLVADKAIAAPTTGSEAPAPFQGLQFVPRSIVDISLALEKPTFLRTLLVEVVWGPALGNPPEKSCRPDPRTAIERVGRLIAVAVFTKYLPFQESLRSP